MWPIKDKNLIGQDLCKIHKFKIDDKLYVFDVASARYFKIDRITWDILEGLEHLTIEEIGKRLEARYPPLEVQQSIKELERKKRKGLLFTSSKPPYFKKTAVRKFCDVRHLKKVTIYPALDCNLSCGYCFHPYGKMKTYMNEATAKKAVDFILKHSYRKCHVDFHGGEPLLNFKIIKYITEELAQRAKKCRKKFTFSIGTNGTICTEEIAEFLKKFDFGIALSLDGPEDIHNAMRRYPDGRPSHKEVITNLGHWFCRYLDPKRINILAVLYPGHFDRFEEIYRYLLNLQKEMGFKKFIIARTTYRGDLFSKEDLDGYKEVLKKSARSFLKECLSKERFVDTLPHFPNYIKQIRRFRPLKEIRPCPGGIVQLLILADGGLLHCRYVESLSNWKDFIFGNIDNATGINEKGRLLLHKKSSASPQDCLTCWARHFCLPSCPVPNYYATKDFTLPDIMNCEILKTRIECSIWILNELISRRIKFLPVK